ncbi:lipopolysaccharide biosynthesis protein [Patescibacteria group bacterium]
MLEKLKLPKSFEKIAYMGFGMALSAVLNFLLLAVVAKVLDVPTFGKYALITSILVGLARLTDFGTNSIYVAKSIIEVKQDIVKRYVSAKILLFLAGIPISLGILLSLGYSRNIEILLFLTGFGLYGIKYALFGFFQKVEAYTALIVLEVLPSVIKGVIALLAYLGTINFGYTEFWGTFTLSLLPTLFLIPFCPVKMPKINLRKGCELLKESFSPGTAQLTSENFPAITNSFAKIFGNFTNVGIFSLANKISVVFMLASHSIFTVLLPKNALKSKKGSGYDYKETGLLALGLLVLGFLAATIGRFFIIQFFGDKFSDSLPLLNILIVSSAITAIHTFMENYFYVEGKTHFLAKIYGLKVGVFIIAAILLIPGFSLQGLIWSQLIASFITLATVYWLTRQPLPSRSLFP